MDWQAVLDKMVGGLVASDCLWFDGPSTAHVMGVPYLNITVNGKIEEGHHDPLENLASKAVAKFILELADALDQSTQVAWRRRPSIEPIAGGYRVSCRVLPYPEPKEGQ